MARKNNLAALAALAGLGYALTRQSLNKVDLTETKDSNPDRKARPDSTETREAPRRKMTDYINTAPLDDSRTDAASSGDEMSKYAASYKPKVNKPEAKASEVNNQPPLVITKELENLPVKQNAKSLKDRNPPVVITKELKNLPDVRTNFGSLVNPYPVNNKATTNEAAKQAAIEATEKHAEAQKAVMAERLRNQKAQQDLGYGQPLKRGGAVKKMASGGMTLSASSRGDGIATKGKTRGKIC
jgi:hypothetical protein